VRAGVAEVGDAVRGTSVTECSVCRETASSFVVSERRLRRLVDCISAESATASSDCSCASTGGGEMSSESCKLLPPRLRRVRRRNAVNRSDDKVNGSQAEWKKR